LTIGRWTTSDQDQGWSSPALPKIRVKICNKEWELSEFQKKKSNPAKSNNHVKCVLTNPTKRPKARSFLIQCGREFHNAHAPTVNEWPMARDRWWSHKYFPNKVCVVYTFYIRRKNLEKLLSKEFFFWIPASSAIYQSIFLSAINIWCFKQM
jgi:hypothetical protein